MVWLICWALYITLSLTVFILKTPFWVIYIPLCIYVLAKPHSFLVVLLSKENHKGQVERKQLFCAGGYDWWGSLWQCRKLMSQNHESSCWEITPLPTLPVKTQRDIFNSKQMLLERHRLTENETPENERLCHCFTSTVIHFFNRYFSLTIHKLPIIWKRISPLTVQYYTHTHTEYTPLKIKAKTLNSAS